MWVSAIKIFGNALQHKEVPFHVDNILVTGANNTKSSKSKRMMEFVRMFVYRLDIKNVSSTTNHTNHYQISFDNKIADLILPFQKVGTRQTPL